MSWALMSEHLGWGIMEESWRKGPWTAEEDELLVEYVKLHGEGRWNSVARLSGLKRNGKSCRLRWVNYLRPDLKRGRITPHEEGLILELHARWGNRWSTIARSLPGRTDNEIKNYWRTHFKKKTKLAPDDNPVKAKATTLKRQQFQQQLVQKRQHHQQPYLQRLHPNHLFNETEYKVPYPLQMTMQESTTGTNTSYPGVTYHQEQQGSLYPMIIDGNVSSSDVSNEDALWDGLWNLDDYKFHGGFNGACATSKASLHNLVTDPFLLV